MVERNVPPFTRALSVVENGDDPALLKVAFATEGGEQVNQHFGSSKGFVIYGVNIDQAKIQSVIEFAPTQQDGNEDKLIEKLKALEGCIAVYCRACGASALRQLVSIGVQPVKVTEGAEIKALILGLQHELREGPSSWLAKAIRQQKPSETRFDDMESEGWVE